MNLTAVPVLAEPPYHRKLLEGGAKPKNGGEARESTPVGNDSIARKTDSRGGSQNFPLRDSD